MASSFDKYRKTVTAVTGAGISWATLVVLSDPSAITGPEWLAGAVGLATAVGVYATPNDHSETVNAAVASVYEETDPADYPAVPSPSVDEGYDGHAVAEV